MRSTPSAKDRLLGERPGGCSRRPLWAPCETAPNNSPTYGAQRSRRVSRAVGRSWNTSTKRRHRDGEAGTAAVPCRAPSISCATRAPP
jgi:hypothetical protein